MKVKAKHGLFHNGEYHAGGEIFKITGEEYEAISDCVVSVEEPKDGEFVSEVFPPDEDEQPKRGRRKKTED